MNQYFYKCIFFIFSIVYPLNSETLSAFQVQSIDNQAYTIHKDVFSNSGVNWKTSKFTLYGTLGQPTPISPLHDICMNNFSGFFYPRKKQISESIDIITHSFHIEVAYCSPISIDLWWGIWLNSSETYLLIGYIVYLYLDALPPEETDKIEAHSLLEKDYQVEIHNYSEIEHSVEIPCTWTCKYRYAFWYVRAILFDGEHIHIEDSEIREIIIEPRALGYDCFLKGKILDKSTQQIIPTAQIALKEVDYSLNKYFNNHGYFLINYFRGTHEIIIKDKCHEPLSSIIELHPGKTVHKDFELTFNCHSFDLNSDFTIDVKDVILAINILSASNTIKLSNHTNDKSKKTVTLQSTVFALQYISGL